MNENGTATVMCERCQDECEVCRTCNSATSDCACALDAREWEPCPECACAYKSQDGNRDAQDVEQEAPAATDEDAAESETQEAKDARLRAETIARNDAMVRGYRSLQTQIREAKQHYSYHKDEAKEWKETLAGLRKQLETFDATPLPLMERHPEPGPSAEPTEPLLEQSGDSEAWRDVRLDSLDITPGRLEKLAEADLVTLGQLVDFQASKRLTDIKGLGEKAIDQIEDARDAAITAWRKQHPAGAEPEAEESGDPGTLPFPIEVTCFNCGRGHMTSFASREDAVEAGWTDINDEPEMSGAYVGVCPECRGKDEESA